MPSFDRLAESLSRPTESVGRLVARSEVALATQRGVPPNPGSHGYAVSAAADANASASVSSLAQRAVEMVGSALANGVAIEQRLSTPLAAIPFPGFPALCIGNTSAGLPHAHAHPPNLVPPNPVPIPLPGVGPLISIPFVSGAQKTLIEGKFAARCGDMGLAIFCGGLFPISEVFFGSASVWTEGARQARGFVDITKHCVFTTPKPSDPPIGPMVGTTLATAEKTFVGGVPMPSVQSLAMGALFASVFQGVGRVANRLHAHIVVARFMEHTSLHGDEVFQRAARDDLMRIARTAEGRSIMGRIADADKGLEIHAPNSSAETAALFDKYGDHCAPLSNEGHVRVVVDYEGPYVATMGDGRVWKVSVVGDGDGVGSRVVYDPAKWPNSKTPGSPSDVILAHELNHAANQAQGKSKSALSDQDPLWVRLWKNHEEANTVGAENRYRAERGGVPHRWDYSKLP